MKTMRVLVCEDDHRVRRAWSRVIMRTIEGMRENDLLAPECQSVECFLASVADHIAGQTFDVTIIDLLFIGDEPKHSAGFRLWRELKTLYGCTQFGELIIATKFASDEISEFVRKENALLCNGMTDELRTAVLLEAVGRNL